MNGREMVSGFIPLPFQQAQRRCWGWFTEVFRRLRSGTQIRNPGKLGIDRSPPMVLTNYLSADLMWVTFTSATAWSAQKVTA
jgi:hypothetical protein